MTSFVFTLNGDELCVAGIDTEAGVLTGIVNWIKKEGSPDEQFLFVSGTDSVKKELHKWETVPLKIGDRLTITVVEGNEVTKSNVKKNDDASPEMIERKIQYFHQLREELKDYLNE